ncbi:hypothetical protein Tco_0135785, partial [Tanacetum coccineum]
WWNSHVKTTTPEAAHAMTWAALKKMMSDKYCPRGEIKKVGLDAFITDILVMSADSAVTYTSVHFEARSWSIPSEDPYEEGPPPLLPIPLPAPSTSRRADIPVANTPLWKRLLLTTPRPGCEVGESSAAAARQPGPTMARRVDCSSVDTVRDNERRMMAADKC